MKSILGKTSNWKIYIIIGLVLALLAVLAIAGIYVCPLKLILGIPCPLCGMTRAFICLFKGDWALAFYYHPLWPVAALGAIACLLYFLGIIRPGRKLIDAACISVAILFLACFIIRHICGSPVVAIDFSRYSILSHLH